MTLSERVIAVTGASGAMGAAVVKALAAQGAIVAQIDHSPLSAVRSGELQFGGVDLADLQATVAVFERVAAAAGHIDGLVNIAGGFKYQPLNEGSLDAWDAMYRINLLTAVSSCKAALPYLLKSSHGRIVNVGAMGAVTAAAGMGPYAASKAGVAKLTEALSSELKDRGVTVNAVLPGTIDTARNREDMPRADFSKWVTPAQIAAVIAFLLSDAAAAVTGALIPVAGRI